VGEFLLVPAYPGSHGSTAVKPCSVVCVIVVFFSMVLIVCLNGRHIVAQKMSYWLIHSSHRLTTTLLH